MGVCRVFLAQEAALDRELMRRYGMRICDG